MSDFTKEKIAFAIGLLAVLFTLTPALKDYEQLGFAILTLRLELRHLYLFLAATLSLGVYFYGVQFLTTRSIRFFTLVGDVFYALAIVAPALYLCLFLIGLLIEVVTPVLRSPIVLNVLQLTLSTISGAVAALYWNRTRKVLAVKQQQSETRRRTALELGTLRRAEALFRDGHYDLAVVEAFRALEIAVRDASVDVSRGIRRGARDWFQVLMESLPEQVRPSLERARRVRNKAVHAVEPVSEEDAKEALGTTSKVLAVIGSVALDSCPNCGSANLIEESDGDHGFSWSRRRCTNCGWIEQF